LQFQLSYKKFKIVGHCGHIEAVIGLRALAMTALVNSNHVVTKIYQMLGNAIPQPSIGGKSVHHEHGGMGKGGFAPGNAMQMQS
jgi:hypothetical protein